ncbi:MAG: ATP synthase F0 subunit B [Thermodesulfobacteriota bacterium]|nr:ATP synthase F0 subunit B [Thermodesulfobacteriota bacterium]
MNHTNNRHLLTVFFILCVVAAVFSLSPDAFAMEEISKGRKVWDNILLFINFGILVFFFIKYAKRPLIDFLHGERKMLEDILNTVNEKLKEAKSLMNAEADKLKDIDGRLQEIRGTIIEIGQKEKEKTIETAKITAKKMIEDAQKESEYKLDMAKKTLTNEMVDIAISLVEKRLKKRISAADDKKFIDQFLGNLDKVKRYHT